MRKVKCQYRNCRIVMKNPLTKFGIERKYCCTNHGVYEGIYKWRERERAKKIAKLLGE